MSVRIFGEFIEACDDVLLPVHVGEKLAGLAERLGFTSTLIVDVAALTHNAHSPIVYSRLPTEFETYRHATPFAENPLALYAAATDEPFDLTEACAALGFRESDLRRSLFRPVQDKHIVVLPVHKSRELVLFVACAGDRPEDGPVARRMLHAAAHAVYDLILSRAANWNLTAREAECLAAVAHGNSYEDVGRLLGIAARTVRAAIASAKRKLHARSQAQAIIRAMGIDAQPTRTPKMPS